MHVAEKDLLHEMVKIAKKKVSVSVHILYLCLFLFCKNCS
jgi:hypothetical protein